MPALTKILVANRGEIAVRVFRTARELGIGTVAVYSDADRDRLHVAVADEAYLLGPGPASESYLRADRIVEVALRAEADSVHPGYGFLAENAEFARRVEAAGLVWIGPPPEAIEAMGSKIAARERMRAAGVPVVPGTTRPATSIEDVLDAAAEVGYPIAVKASAGGGGKGLRVAHAADEVERAFETARREGAAYFADDAVYVERYLDDPRHVEVQILADSHGNVIHLGERDCTIQRRHQKLVEETPSPAVDAELRERIGEIAIDAARAVGYRSAGTIEGLLDTDGSYYFLEMNTRVQVEHTVTEVVTGIDIVREQIHVAAGEPLSVTQKEVELRGHAIECRINAEDASRAFLPSPGRITAYREPAGIGVRVDSGVRAGDEISELYDPMIAKLIVHDVDREHARKRMLRALEEFVIEGPTTLLGFHRALLETTCFVEGGTCRGVVESEELAQRAQELDQLSLQRTSIAASADGRPAGGATRDRVVAVEIDGRRHEVRLHDAEPPWAELARRHRERSRGLVSEATGAVTSPMQGTVLSVAVGDGDAVSSRRPDLCRRGHEDGERDRLARRRRRRRACRSGGRAGLERSGHLRDHVSVSTSMRCADVSELAGEPIGATAIHAERWLLIEVAGTWPRDVSGGDGLSAGARRAAQEWLERNRPSRLLFVRRPGRSRGSAQLAFVGHAAEREGTVRRIELSTPDELADVDLQTAGESTSSPLVLVCGHGTRDACCALRGTAVYSRLADHLGDDELWISSHQGGHRFATNVLVLPAGIQLGRVPAENAASIVAKALTGRIELAHYRGRVAYPAPVQAAEGAIREEEGLDRLADLQLLDVDGDRARFRDLDGREHTAIAERHRGPSVPASCGAAAEPQVVVSARVV